MRDKCFTTSMIHSISQYFCLWKTIRMAIKTLFRYSFWHEKAFGRKNSHISSKNQYTYSYIQKCADHNSKYTNQQAFLSDPEGTYRPITIVIVASFVEYLSEVRTGSICLLRPTEKVGGLGCWWLLLSPSNIKTTEDMVGLSTAWSCTHKSPTCMHRNTSRTE